MSLEAAYADGQLAALARYKLGWPAPTNPTVQDSAVLRATETPKTPPEAQAAMQPPTTPLALSQIFDAHEQGKTRTEPRRKLSADNLCTTCRKEKHYGPCDAPRKIPEKAADFNMGMRGDDPSVGDNPSTSPHYHAATTADTSLARARDGRPADEQAGTMFADLFRHLGISNAADEPGRMTGGLHKVAGLPRQMHVSVEPPDEGTVTRAYRSEFPFYRAAAQGGGRAIAETLSGAAHPLAPQTASFVEMLMRGAQKDRGIARQLLEAPRIRLANWQLWGTDGHSRWEDRGPGQTPNPYEERLTVKSPPLGWGDEGPQRIERAFDQIDGAVDTTNIEDAAKGQPATGPAALG